MKRRAFITKAGVVGAGSLVVPSFLQAASMHKKLGHKRLVVVQLSGGNDGLNTFVPYENDLYYHARPHLGLRKEEVIPINDQIGLHPSIEPLKELFDEGEMVLINNVGYPNPIRSHFKSRDVWHMGVRDHVSGDGWVGRYLDQLAKGDLAKEYLAIEMNGSLTLSMRGKLMNALAMKSPEDFIHAYEHAKFSRYIDFNKSGDQKLMEYLYQSVAYTGDVVGYLKEKLEGVSRDKLLYPRHKFGKNLNDIARLIESGIETSVYYVSLGRFDTHVGQRDRQATQLKKMADGLKVFVVDLKRLKAFEDTTIMVFSEFGRRVNENASNGTDHGTANNVFLLNGKFKNPGVYNDLPNLSDLDQGDLKYNLDFRSVYKEVLENGLGVKSASIIKGDFDKLNVL